MKNKVSYTAVNTFETLNSLTDSTKNIWFVFHGMGYLSRYFLRHFQGLPAQENYVIAPQAPSKYYLDSGFSKIGANWLTREHTVSEMENILSYLDAVMEHISPPEHLNIVVLGFSQGVSIASRWVARRKIDCHKLILYSGGIPKDIRKEDYNFLKANTEVYLVHGDSDPYLNPERLALEEEKFNRLFGGKGRITTFEGGHSLIPTIVEKIVDP